MSMQPPVQLTQGKKIAVVLLNMGGPENLDDVRPFLYNLFADPDIINLPRFLSPFQRQLAWLIAKFRTPGTSNMYEQIGNGSPILEITQNLADKVRENLNKKNELTFQSHVLFRYTPPRAKEVVSKLQEDNIDTVVLFSQYPHYADSTTGSSLKDFYAELENSDYQPSTIVEIDEWGMENEYINWWVEGIRETIADNNIELSKNKHLIFSAHGLPKRYVDKGENYPDRIKEAAAEILSRLGDIPNQITHHVSFQSQAGPIEWTKPYTDELLEEIAQKDDQSVIIVPLGFVSNHVETLYEIDILYKDQALEDGIVEYYRVEVPDADDHYAAQMSELVYRRLKEDL